MVVLIIVRIFRCIEWQNGETSLEIPKENNEQEETSHNIDLGVGMNMIIQFRVKTVEKMWRRPQGMFQRLAIT